MYVCVCVFIFREGILATLSYSGVYSPYAQSQEIGLSKTAPRLCVCVCVCVCTRRGGGEREFRPTHVDIYTCTIEVAPSRNTPTGDRTTAGAADAVGGLREGESRTDMGSFLCAEIRG